MDPHWVMKYYKTNPFPDVVLCDYLMPDMDGYEVYVAMKEMGYKGEFIFVTGAEHILRDNHGDDLEETKIIAKPYSVEDFKDIVSAR
jgi:CheY-like chemotaxis protein